MVANMTYAGSGVDYDAMDPFKRSAQTAGIMTANKMAARRPGFVELYNSRGESCYLVKTPSGCIAHVEEGLGTKNLVADAMYELTGKSYYDHIAQDTVAMIVNDMITVGALPVSVAMHIAVGDSRWFEDERRVMDLIVGWKNACEMAGCVWGGGETPTLKDVIAPDAVVLSGSAWGTIEPANILSGANIQEGDRIVLLESSGIHANGLSLARKIAAKLPHGYLSVLSDGRFFGEALLDPTVIYVKLIETLLERGLELHYTANITGHGWRKLMRASQPFAYVIERIPEPHPVFRFIQEHGPVSDEEAYGNLNMGAGFALFVPEGAAAEVCGLAAQLGYRPLDAGYVVDSAERRVIVKPKDLTFEAKTLAIR